MKPLRLGLQAFGPFAGREDIDFTRLPPGALFLISGPTGAGKTSILDGITYALYGDTSGGERSAREMRSHHADAATQTEVELEFALGERRYRVRRIPEQERTAQRGSGLVKVAARAELWRWETGAAGADWLPVSQRSTEVTRQIAELLGFEADQFRQVVLLPQGQFRKLLAADSRERERILETLFGTAAYKRVQDALKAEAATLRQRAEEARLRRQTLLEQAGAESPEALQLQRKALAEALAGLQEVEKSARAQDAQARQDLQRGQGIETRFVEREAAAQALAALEACLPEIDKQRRQLALARQAQGVVPADQALVAARRAVEDARLRQSQAAAAAEAAAAALARARKRLDEEVAQAPEREAAQRELMRLEALVEAVARLDQAEAARRGRQEQKRAADEALASATQQRAEGLARRDALLQRIDAVQPLAARADALALRLRQAARREEDGRRLEAARKQSLACEQAEARRRQALDAARAALEAARADFDRLDAAWRRGQAAVLASHLHDGAPCPVCGSADHPAPARFDAALPGEAALQAAMQAVRDAEAVLDGARAALDAAAQQRAGAQAEVATREAAVREHVAHDDASPTAAETAAAIQHELDAARAAATELTSMREQLQVVEAALTTATERHEAARQAVAVADAALAAARHLAEDRCAAVPDELRAPAALEAALSAARARVQRLQAALQTAQAGQAEAASREAGARAQGETLGEAARLAAAHAGEAVAQLAAALQQSGFASEAEYRAAVLVPDALEAVAAAVQGFDESQAAARERQTRAREALEGLARPDLPALEAAAAAARERLEQTLGELGRQRGELGRADRTLEALAAIARESGEIEAQYRVAGHVAAVANGENGRNLTFQRYVLAALLDDVLRAASHRLKAMSRGRYLLQRREDVADGRRAAGLDLEVLDDYTGRARPASTLSGGEGFMASLSLALGLSDVVQAYAGGVQLDTLFIDEGFGSLDPESLDMAMKTLIDLQQKGRMVGVISHVEEMKQQIDVAIEVVQDVRGSRVRLRP